MKKWFNVNVEPFFYHFIPEDPFFKHVKGRVRDEWGLLLLLFLSACTGAEMGHQ